jgi:hypothetical protein
MKNIIAVYKEWADGKAEDLEVGAQMGEYEITRIEYHEAQGEGDAHYVDVHMDDGAVRRIFSPDEVIFEPEE